VTAYRRGSTRAEFKRVQRVIGNATRGEVRKVDKKNFRNERKRAIRIHPPIAHSSPATAIKNDRRQFSWRIRSDPRQFVESAIETRDDKRKSTPALKQPGFVNDERPGLDDRSSLRHSDERGSKENGQRVVRRCLYKYIYLVCGALVLGGSRWNVRLSCVSIGFLQGPCGEISTWRTFEILQLLTKFCHCSAFTTNDAS